MIADIVGGSVRDVAGDAVDRLCFLSDALSSKPTSDLDAASRRGLGGILEDVAVMLADALAQEGREARAMGAETKKAKAEGRCRGEAL